MVQSLACHEYNEDLHKDAAIIIIKVIELIAFNLSIVLSHDTTK